MNEDELREIAWDLCKQYDSANKRRTKIALSSFVSWELSTKYGDEFENYWRNESQDEVKIFCNKYGYED